MWTLNLQSFSKFEFNISKITTIQKLNYIEEFINRKIACQLVEFELIANLYKNRLV